MDEVIEGIDTSRDYIPKKLKSAAYDMWGRDGCIICGSSSGINLAHVSHDGSNPYKNTKPFNLIPLCSSCHNKVDWGEYYNEEHDVEDDPFRNNEHIQEDGHGYFTRYRGGFFKILVTYLSKRMAEMTKLTLEEYLNENIDELIDNYSTGIKENQKEMILDAYERLGIDFNKSSLDEFAEVKS